MKLLTATFCLLLTLGACDNPAPSNIQKQNVDIETNAQGRTVEQENILARYKMDSNPAALKHLYIVSAMSGDVILYSTVKGKVTSSGKRLSPYNGSGLNGNRGYTVRNMTVYTSEVMQDDGTFGSSVPYIFWFDQRGNYHQHYPSGGQVIHVSDVPMSWPKIILNLEETD